MPRLSVASTWTERLCREERLRGATAGRHVILLDACLRAGWDPGSSCLGMGSCDPGLSRDGIRSPPFPDTHRYRTVSTQQEWQLTRTLLVLMFQGVYQGGARCAGIDILRLRYYSCRGGDQFALLYQPRLKRHEPAMSQP